MWKLKFNFQNSNFLIQQNERKFILQCTLYTNTHVYGRNSLSNSMNYFLYSKEIFIEQKSCFESVKYNHTGQISNIMNYLSDKKVFVKCLLHFCSYRVWKDKKLSVKRQFSHQQNDDKKLLICLKCKVTLVCFCFQSLMQIFKWKYIQNLSQNIFFYLSSIPFKLYISLNLSKILPWKDESFLKMTSKIHLLFNSSFFDGKEKNYPLL